jgi:hypothetical protein
LRPLGWTRVDEVAARAKENISRARRSAVILAFTAGAAALPGAAAAWFSACAGGRVRALCQRAIPSTAAFDPVTEERTVPKEAASPESNTSAHASPEYSKTLSFLSTSPFLLTACNRGEETFAGAPGNDGVAPEAVIPAVSLGGSDQLATVVRRRLAQNGGPSLQSPLHVKRRSRDSV